MKLNLLRPAAFFRLLLVLLLALSYAALAAPLNPPDWKPEKPKENALSTADLRKLGKLMQQSIQLMKDNKYPEAEKALEDALALDPKQPACLYNMACLKALTGKPEAAMDYLEKSAEQGFVDFAFINHDEDLKSVRSLPRFKALLARKDELQKRFVQEVVKALEQQFGKGYLYEIDNSDKLVFATNTDPDTLEGLKKNLIRQTRALRKMIFTEKPDQYINVVLPSLKDYSKINKDPRIAGFYNDESRTLISRQLGQVMTHEFTHALHYADFRPLGQEHPIWLLEGFATLFEGITWKGSKPTPHDSEHLAALQFMAKKNQLVPLAKLMKMTYPQFMRNPLPGYGESGSVLLYLYEQGLLTKYYGAVKTGYNEKAPDRGTIAALEKTTGKTLGDFETDWRKWMQGRTPPPETTGPNGPYLGVRFGQNNDGLKVDYILTNSPAAKGGIKPGDVIVGVDGIDVRDHQTLIPLLNNHKVGDRVALRVRRGGKYQVVKVVLEKRSEEQASAMREAGSEDPIGEIQLSPVKGGMEVVGLDENGPAGKAGLKAGDLLIGINNLPVKDMRSFASAMRKLQEFTGDNLSLKIRRDGKEQTLEVNVAEPPSGRNDGDKEREKSKDNGKDQEKPAPAPAKDKEPASTKP